MDLPAYPTSSSGPEPAPVTSEVRWQLLDSAVNRAAMQGGRLVTRGQTEAVLEYGKPVNHILHAILTIFMCGLWAPVWLVISMQTNVVRRTVLVDEYGRTWISGGAGLVPF